MTLKWIIQLKILLQKALLYTTRLVTRIQTYWAALRFLIFVVKIKRTVKTQSTT